MKKQLLILMGLCLAASAQQQVPTVLSTQLSTNRQPVSALRTITDNGKIRTVQEWAEQPIKITTLQYVEATGPLVTNLMDIVTEPKPTILQTNTVKPLLSNTNREHRVRPGFPPPIPLKSTTYRKQEKEKP